MTFKTICIYGAGALGGTIAAKLATGLGGAASISVVARGPHLQGIRSDGLQLFEAGAESPIVAQVTATDDPASLPKQDLVITGLKGHQLGQAAAGIAGMLHETSRVVMVLNGIPWWYFHRDQQSGHADLQFADLDPHGALWTLVGPQRVIGCVAHQGAEVASPGQIRLSNKGRFILGEPSGEMTADLDAIASLLARCGIAVSTTPRIRDEIWSKLMGNASFNPISALTRALMSDIMADLGLSNLVSRVMNEVKAVGEALGATFAITIEERLEQARQIGPTRTSMLQDLLAGKSLEITPLVGMVVSLGQLVSVPTPASETILALVTQLDRENMRTAV